MIQTISEALALFDEVLAYPWERTVVYQGNGPLVSEVPPPDDGPWNRPLYLTMAVPRRSGFRFVSWNTRPDGWGGGTGSPADGCRRRRAASRSSPSGRACRPCRPVPPAACCTAAAVCTVGALWRTAATSRTDSARTMLRPGAFFGSCERDSPLLSPGPPGCTAPGERFPRERKSLGLRGRPVYPPAPPNFVPQMQKPVFTSRFAAVDKGAAGGYDSGEMKNP